MTLVGLAAPAAYAVDTAGTPHTGSIPSAGPSVAGATGGGFGGGFPGGRFGAAPGQNPLGGNASGPDGQRADGGAGARGGPGATETADTALVALLRTADTRWAAATLSAQSGAGLELSSGASVMAIGGFSGSDPSPTLEQFQTYVATGQVRWFISGGGQLSGPGGRGGTGSAITAWVQEHFTATTVGGQQVYDLTQPLP